MEERARISQSQTLSIKHHSSIAHFMLALAARETCMKALGIAMKPRSKETLKLTSERWPYAFTDRIYRANEIRRMQILQHKQHAWKSTWHEVNMKWHSQHITNEISYLNGFFFYKCWLMVHCIFRTNSFLVYIFTLASTYAHKKIGTPYPYNNNFIFKININVYFCVYFNVLLYLFVITLHLKCIYIKYISALL